MIFDPAIFDELIFDTGETVVVVTPPVVVTPTGPSVGGGWVRISNATAAWSDSGTGGGVWVNTNGQAPAWSETGYSGGVWTTDEPPGGSWAN